MWHNKHALLLNSKSTEQKPKCCSPLIMTTFYEIFLSEKYNDIYNQSLLSTSSLAKGFAHGPLSLHPWQIELDFVIPADRHLVVFTKLAYKR